MYFVKTFLVVCFIVLFVQCSKTYKIDNEPVNTWEKFKTTFNKVYPSTEKEDYRRAIFEKTLAWVQENNGKDDLSFGINFYSDLSDDEFSQMRGSKLVTKPSGSEMFKSFTVDPNIQLPPNINYTDFFGPIELQINHCGDCWAFAAAGTAEGVYAKAHPDQGKISLSKQELLDCAGAGDCNGGYVTDAWNYMKKENLTDEAHYPHTGVKGACQKHLRHLPLTSVSVTDFEQLTVYGSDLEMMTALVEKGPLGVSIYANDLVFKNYKGNGIIKDFPNSIAIDHGVVLVGYGHREETNQDYWIIRNSWGEAWGDNGYGYLLRNQSTRGVNFLNYAITVA